MNLILLVGPICGWLGAKDWNPPLVNIYAVTSILWFFFAVALFGWFLYLGITDKWRRYFVSDVTPGWFWFSCFWAVRRPHHADMVVPRARGWRDDAIDAHRRGAPSSARRTPTGGQVRAPPPSAGAERGRAAAPRHALAY